MSACYKIFHIIALLLLFLPVNLRSQTLDINFKEFSIKDGMSFGIVFSMAQDSVGFLWFATRHGLNRYDGYEFKQYVNDPSDPNSLSDNEILHLFVDLSGNLWVCTINGLNKYDSYLDHFIHYKNDPHNPNSLSSNSIKCIDQDGKKNYWILTTQGQLFRTNKSFMEFSHYPNDFSAQKDLRNGSIQAIYIDRSDNLWLAQLIDSENILTQLDTKDLQLIQSMKLPHRTGTTGLKHVETLYEDRYGDLWIGSNGLFRYSTSNKTFDHFQHDPENPYSLSNNRITSILEDSQGDLWIGTAWGVNRFDRIKNHFYHQVYKRGWIINIFEDNSGVLWLGTFDNAILKHDRENQQFAPPVFSDFCTSIIEDHAGIIWTGNSEGLHRIDRRANKHTLFNINPPLANGTHNNKVVNIWENKVHQLWVGFTHGLYEFDRKNKRFKKFDVKLTSSNIPLNEIDRQMIENDITATAEDSSGMIWIGTTDGLYRYDNENNELYLYLHDKNDPGSLHHNFIRNFRIGKSGTVWVCAQDLHRYDRQTDSFKRDFSDPHHQNGPGHNQVIDIYESEHGPEGTYWLGTEIGLFRFDRASKSFKHYTDKDGLPHSHIRVIVEDRNGYIWLPTLNGISKFDPEKEVFKNYTGDDGLQGNYYFDMIQNDSGEMITSGRNGISVFHPDSIIDDPRVPAILLTSLKLFNQEIELDSSISRKKKITLSAEENMLSFEFASLDFTNPSKNQFAYKLEGFDRSWIHIGNDNHTTYTNLPPGEFTFRVKGTNHDGIWNETGASIGIIILPPLWRTTPAYILYFIIIATTVMAIRRFQINRLQMKHELEMEHLHAEKLQEVDRVKTRFYTNISHEFRTPLTLILGPLEKMLSHTRNQQTKRNLSIMKRNAQRLYQLINQLLDLAKLEAGRMKLKVQKINIAKLANRCVQSFESQAKLKNIQLKFESDEKEIQIFIDREKIEDVCYNLISNALKFTPVGGEIKVSVGYQTAEEHTGNLLDKEKSGPNNSQFPIPNFKYITITVSDTGMGISPNRLNKIFDRFYQVDESMTRTHEGSGIGLALTKELVELHHGEIKVASKTTGHRDGSGSTVTVYLPLGKDHFAAGEIFHENDPTLKQIENDSQRKEPPVMIGKPHPAERAIKDSEQPLLLIVEDNRDLRNYLHESLQNLYRIIEAEDGKEGLKRSIEEIPDLIISDVMMPKMDGIELCRSLKTDERTDHIPVVLLTARADIESKIEGLETGADDYLPKPFDATELMVRIKNLVEQRQKLREKYAKEISINSTHITISSINEKFLNRALEYIEEHLSDPKLTVELFGKEMGMSRVQLHRKLKALTTLSASELIRTLRLKHAARLLQQNYGNIAEIAYKVGFNSPSYFAECFQKQFGKLPSEYSS